jgi:hypothetical protein
MELFRLNVEYSPGEEGDNWQSSHRSRCGTCGTNAVRFRDRFPTADDNVEMPSLYLDDSEVPPFFRIAGVYFVTHETKTLLNSQLDASQLSFRPVAVETTCQQPVFWMPIPGRLEIEPNYYFIGQPCPECEIAKQEKVSPRPHAPRYAVRQSSVTGRYLSAVHEQPAPDIVDQEFKAVLEAATNSFRHPLVTFTNVPVVAN